MKMSAEPNCSRRCVLEAKFAVGFRETPCSGFLSVLEFAAGRGLTISEESDIMRDKKVSIECLRLRFSWLDFISTLGAFL